MTRYQPHEDPADGRHKNIGKFGYEIGKIWNTLKLIIANVKETEVYICNFKKDTDCKLATNDKSGMVNKIYFICKNFYFIKL